MQPRKAGWGGAHRTSYHPYLRPVPLLKPLATFLFRRWGWSVAGPLPYDLPKCLVVVYPHTSNWDFPVGVLFREVYGISIGFVAKHSLFRGPLGWAMRALGGRAVVRTGNTKFVGAVAEVFRRADTFRLCVTPEGTRARTDTLKSGFHYMARAAGVPIVWCAFEWPTKTMRWSGAFWPDDDYERSLAAFHEFFRGTVGYHPEDAYAIPA